MAYFKIQEPNKAPKYIKSIDRFNGTLEFSENREGCFQQDSGFFADSELAYLKFHFKEQYPEIEYLTVDSSYYTTRLQENEAQWNEAAPQMPAYDAPHLEQIQDEPQFVNVYNNTLEIQGMARA